MAGWSGRLRAGLRVWLKGGSLPGSPLVLFFPGHSLSESILRSKLTQPWFSWRIHGTRNLKFRPLKLGPGFKHTNLR